MACEAARCKSASVLCLVVHSPSPLLFSVFWQMAARDERIPGPIVVRMGSGKEHEHDQWDLDLLPELL